MSIENGYEDAPGEILWGRDWIPDWLWSFGYFLFGDQLNVIPPVRWFFFKEMTPREQMDIFNGGDEDA